MMCETIIILGSKKRLGEGTERKKKELSKKNAQEIFIIINIEV